MSDAEETIPFAKLSEYVGQLQRGEVPEFPYELRVLAGEVIDRRTKEPIQITPEYIDRLAEQAASMTD